MAFIIKRSECSICGKKMDPFSGCKHIKGKVYSGELCHEIITDGEPLGIDMVTKPSMKDCVIFDDIENPTKYQSLEFLIPQLPNEYVAWDYNIIQGYKPHAEYKIGRNDLCPCHSGKKYKNCCMNNPKGVKCDHYKFIIHSRS